MPQGRVAVLWYVEQDSSFWGLADQVPQTEPKMIFGVQHEPSPPRDIFGQRHDDENSRFSVR